MRNTRLRIAVLVALAVGGIRLAAQAPANATAKCKDGTYSTATSSRGRCSAHGGVAQLLNTTSTSTSSSTTTTTTSSANSSTAAGGAPAGATFQCKDGSYSKAKTATGACSSHGGVGQSLNANATTSSTATTSSSASNTTTSGGAPAGATFQCKDGTYSKAKTSQGACSNHGGVNQALTASAPAAATAPPPTPTPAPSAAAGAAASSSSSIPTVARPAGVAATVTAKCKDGTYSESKQHSGSCSHHGGVAEWYQ